MKKLKIEYIATDKLKPYENNAKIHTQEQIEQIKASIIKFGMNDPIGIWGEDNIIVEGHGRLIACKQMGIEEVPIIRLDGLTDEQRKAYTLVHNQTTLNTGFDLEILNQELANIEIDMDEFGFELELGDIEPVVDEDDNEEVEVEEDEIPEVPEEPTAQVGDIYQLGNHRLMCGDSTSMEDIKKLMENEKADLVFTDPPYGMKKESAGVTNDNLGYDALLEFNKKWIPITFANLKENGSWYCWGIDEPLMDIYVNILKPMIRQNKITFRNLITWDKGNVPGMRSPEMRMYPRADEKCLFVMCGVQNYNNNKYFEGWEPIRSYLEDEAKKVGLTPKKLQEICGVNMYSHWFTKSQFTLIPKEQYHKLQKYYKDTAFQKPYDNAEGIREQSNLAKRELSAEFYDTRAYFNNTHDNMNNVWHFRRISSSGSAEEAAEKAETGGHPTPKPIAVCSRAIKSSSRVGEIVLDVFAGSGSTLMTCEQLDRKCYCMELEPKWVDVIIKRWENYTGSKAIKVN